MSFMSCGEDHVAVINRNGELWTWGLNTHGQCGVQDQEVISAPVQPFKGSDHSSMSFVACGGKHTLALSANSEVFAWGNNEFGQLGLAADEFESFHTPREVFYFKEKIVSWLAAGSNHSLALNIEGYCYTWGRNDKGQLGHGD